MGAPPSRVRWDGCDGAHPSLEAVGAVGGAGRAVPHLAPLARPIPRRAVRAVEWTHPPPLGGCAPAPLPASRTCRGRGSLGKIGANQPAGHIRHPHRGCGSRDQGQAWDWTSSRGPRGRGRSVSRWLGGGPPCRSPLPLSCACGRMGRRPSPPRHGEGAPWAVPGLQGPGGRRGGGRPALGFRHPAAPLARPGGGGARGLGAWGRADRQPQPPEGGGRTRT